jgi:hypothetical protein
MDLVGRIPKYNHLTVQIVDVAVTVVTVAMVVIVGIHKTVSSMDVSNVLINKRYDNLFKK